MKNLLWIDDDEELIDTSVPLFYRNGFNVFKATNTSRALAILRDNIGLLDGILLDVRLHGDENGLELLDEIIARHPKLKIAMFTAYPEYEDHILAERIGASIYLTKIDKSIPLDPEEQKKFFAALHQIFAPRLRKMTEPESSASSNTVNLYLSTMLFLFLFLAILVFLAIVSNLVSPALLPIVLISSILIYSVIGAFVLRTQGDRYLTEKGFLALMLESWRYLPLLRRKQRDQRD